MTDLYAMERTKRDRYREREIAAAQLLAYLPIRRAVERPPRPPRNGRAPLLMRVARLLRHGEGTPCRPVQIEG